MYVADESQGRKKMQHAMIIQNDLLLQSKSGILDSECIFTKL